MRSIEHSFKTLADLITRIKYYQQILSLSIENQDHLDVIKHNGFYKYIRYQNSISIMSKNLIIIDSCSFIDEYQENLSPKNYNQYSEKILLLKKINSPAIKRVNKWKDLKKYRRTLLVHNLRIKGEYIYSLEEKEEYKIPNSNNEIELLVELLSIISKNIGFIFPKIVKNIDFKKKIRDHIDIIESRIDLDNEIKQIESKINKLKIEI